MKIISKPQIFYFNKWQLSIRNSEKKRYFVECSQFSNLSYIRGVTESSVYKKWNHDSNELTSNALKMSYNFWKFQMRKTFLIRIFVRVASTENEALVLRRPPTPTLNLFLNPNKQYFRRKLAKCGKPRLLRGVNPNRPTLSSSYLAPNQLDLWTINLFVCCICTFFLDNAI